MTVKICAQNVNDFSPGKNKCGLIILSNSSGPSGLPQKRFENNIAEEIVLISGKLNSGELKNFEIIKRGNYTIIVSSIPTIKDKPGLSQCDREMLAVSSSIKTLKSFGIQNFHLFLNHSTPLKFEWATLAISLSTYKFDKYKSSKDYGDLSFTLYHDAHRSDNAYNVLVHEADVIANEVNFCRTLVNEPGSFLTPDQFDSVVNKSIKDLKNVKIEKIDDPDLIPGLYTVGKGSSSKPRMIVLKYNGRKEKDVDLVLVGKGVTFDTGGISIKPSANMWEMKGDMAGAGVALSTFLAIAKLKTQINLSVVLCLAENRPGTKSVLPGDIFRARNGKTVMVDNTDAEGRLILTDGLHKACELKPRAIIDIATLTGSIVAALGSSIAGLFSNSDALSETILKSSMETGEKLWAMPLEEEYADSLKDHVADLSNMGKGPGSITAALFLKEFVLPEMPWAHIDIAGVFHTNGWKYLEKGATGWGVRTLVDVVRSMRTEQ